MFVTITFILKYKIQYSLYLFEIQNLFSWVIKFHNEYFYYVFCTIFNKIFLMIIQWNNGLLIRIIQMIYVLKYVCYHLIPTYNIIKFYSIHYAKGELQCFIIMNHLKHLTILYFELLI